MSLPAFTAEAALSRTGDRHYVGGAPAGEPRSTQAIVPQNVPCDIAIRCINGRLYMTTDCPGGAGETIVIGECARPMFRPRPREGIRLSG
jgi:hypothetical protein